MIKLYFFPRISKQWEPRFKGNTNFSFEPHFFFLPSVSFLPLIIISFFFFSSNLSPFHYSLTLLNRSPLREISNSKNSLYNKFLFRFLIPIFAPYDFPSPIYHFNRSISLPILPSTSKSPHTKHFDARANSQARSFIPPPLEKKILAREYNRDSQRIHLQFPLWRGPLAGESGFSIKRAGAQCVDGYCTYTTRPLVRSQAVDGRGGGEWKGVYRGGGGARERKGGQSRTEKYSIYWISTWATITSVSFDLSIAGPRFDGKRMISWGREERERKEWQVSMDVSWAWLIRDDNRLLSKQRRR